MKLNLGGAQKSAERPAISYDAESNIHARVDVVFQSTEGEELLRKTVSAGDTVAQIKKLLADERGLAYASLTLLLDGKRMLDPYSLNDLPAAKDKTALVIVVQVALKAQ